MMYLKIEIIIVFSLILIGCKNNSGTTKNQNSKTIELNPFIEEWVSVEKEIPYSATLLIEKDNSFSFNYGACQSFGFSSGVWLIKNHALFLTNDVCDSCYYTREFGVNCTSFSDLSDMTKKRKTTVEGCSPKGMDEYLIFTNEQFIIKNDTLIHIISKETPCPQMTDKFVRKKNTANTP